MSDLHVVTGGAGYFGELLVSKLLEAGHRVRIFDVNVPEERTDGVDFQQGDVRDPEAVQAACTGARVVHHNVAMVPLAKDRDAFWSVNREGTRNVLQACTDQGVRKLVSTSSSAVFGVPLSNPVNEQTEPRPGEAYGEAKLAAERICHEYAERGLDVAILRPRTILGHGRLGIMQILFEWVRNGRNIPVLGKGDNVYQFVHADDLAAASILAGEKPGSSVYNIGAAEFGTMRETLEGLVEHAGTRSRVVSVPMWPAVLGMRLTSRLGLSPLGPYHALMYGRSLYFDISHARRDLGWEPRYSNVEMIRESYDWYLAHRDEILARSGTSHHRSAVRQGVLALVSRLL